MSWQRRAKPWRRRTASTGVISCRSGSCRSPVSGRTAQLRADQRLQATRRSSMTLDPNRWTLRTAASDKRCRRAGSLTASQADVTPEHLLAAILAQPEGVRCPSARTGGCGHPRSATRSKEASPPSRRRTAPTSRPSRARAATSSRQRTPCVPTWATSTSLWSTCCCRCPI